MLLLKRLYNNLEIAGYGRAANAMRLQGYPTLAKELLIEQERLRSVKRRAIERLERVKKAKGENRPINSESVRQQILLNFKWVNDVEIFSNDEELTNLVRLYSPDYMIVGSDWEGKHVIGSEYAKIVGFFERIDEFSTTEIIKRIAAG